LPSEELDYILLDSEEKKQLSIALLESLVYAATNLQIAGKHD
jgi:hypothetical protein